MSDLHFLRTPLNPIHVHTPSFRAKVELVLSKLFNVEAGKVEISLKDRKYNVLKQYKATFVGMPTS